jgi:predicted ATPase
VRDQRPSGVRVAELGLVHLKGLAGVERVFGVTADGLAERFGPLRGSVRVDPDRPAAGRLVGRQAELNRILGLVAEHRAVTLTGAGGVGKTSLAAAAAELLDDRFRDGVWWVDLAPVPAGGDVAPVVAGAVRVNQQSERSPSDAIASALSDQHLLLVLDNCEHVIDSAAALCGNVLARCPTVSVLATSRIRLGLASEQDVAVRPLAVDGANSVAFQLLVERIGRPELVDLPEERVALDEICHRLDGLPLALELAASRCRTMAPTAVASRLGERIRLPTARGSQSGARATLEGTVRWSYDLLQPVEQAVFARLAVFAGSFSLEAVETVATCVGDLDEPSVDDALLALVEHSLVEHDFDRYRLLETTRAFACDELAASGHARLVEAAHLRWALDFVRRVRPGLRGPDEAYWVDVLDLDWANIRAAFRHALELDDPEPATELVVLLFIEAGFRRAEAIGWILETHGRYGSTAQPHRHELLGAAGWASWVRGDPRAALELGRLAIAADPAQGTAIDRLPQWALAAGLVFTGDPVASRAVLTPMLDGLSDDPYLHSIWLYLYALACVPDQCPTDGAELRSERIAQALGNPTAMAFGAFARAMPVMQTDPKAAVAHLEDAAQYARSVRARSLEQAIADVLLSLRGSLGLPPSETLALTLENAHNALRQGNLAFASGALLTFARCLLDLNRPEDAALCFHVLNQSPNAATDAIYGAPIAQAITESIGVDEMARLEEAARALDFAGVLRIVAKQRTSIG